ncbi:MAG: SDR family NAD(P)-dependent oxidoreductase [Chloroflexota bacterium]|nr:SDR family NAD(P)-dependent oxidoreductase [Chloroflexota bacterium]
MARVDLHDQVVMISGASSGFGAATAQAFAAEGARLALCARRQDRLDDAVAMLTAAGAPRVLTYAADVRDPDQVAGFVRATLEAFGRIDILVNNAGLARRTDEIASQDAATWDAWNEMLDTNVKGLLALTRQVLPTMLAQESGHIINLSSIAAHVAYEGGSVYAGSKHAVRAITQALRLEVAERRVRVTAISPGLAETEFSVVRFGGDQARADAVYAGMTPLTAEDVADCVVFAASRPWHVNIDELILKPTDQPAVHKVIRRPVAQ